MTNGNIELVIFDLDGTLVDSAKDIVTSVNRTLNEFNRESLSHDHIVAHIGEGLKKLLMSFFPEAYDGDEAYRLIEKRFIEIYDEELLSTTTPYPGVIDFLNSWDQKMAIVTNKNEAQALKVIDHLGLKNYPWVHIFGGDSLPTKKPDPLPLNKILATSGVSPRQACMIGDGTPDMGAAKAAGTHSIAISFGYTDLEILQKYDPSGILNHYNELQALLKRL
jgi:phosphoglycolate phosphatase